MTDLKCGVKNCFYNHDESCGKGDIMVGGASAHKSEETCCESFLQKSHEKAHENGHEKGHEQGADQDAKVAYEPSRTILVDCEAGKCIYNLDFRCSADHVDMTGNGATDCRGTYCMTFIDR